MKEEAYKLEYDLTLDYNKNSNYNMKPGGIGGFSKEDAYKGLVARSRKGAKLVMIKKLDFML